MKKIFFYSKAGFSIIELIITISIISILASVFLVSFFYLQKTNDFRLAAQKVANSIRIAQEKAKAVAEDSDWGINISPKKIIIFKGNDFNSRNMEFDEISDLKGIASVSGHDIIIFQKFSGLPDSTESLILSESSSQKTIQINEKGFINY